MCFGRRAARLTAARRVAKRASSARGRPVTDVPPGVALCRGSELAEDDEIVPEGRKRGTEETHRRTEDNARFSVGSRAVKDEARFVLLLVD